MAGSYSPSGTILSIAVAGLLILAVPSQSDGSNGPDIVAFSGSLSEVTCRGYFWEEGFVPHAEGESWKMPKWMKWVAKKAFKPALLIGYGIEPEITYEWEIECDAASAVVSALGAGGQARHVVLETPFDKAEDDYASSECFYPGGAVPDCTATILISGAAFVERDSSVAAERVDFLGFKHQYYDTITDIELQMNPDYLATNYPAFREASPPPLSWQSRTVGELYPDGLGLGTFPVDDWTRLDDPAAQYRLVCWADGDDVPEPCDEAS